MTEQKKYQRWELMPCGTGVTQAAQELHERVTGNTESTPERTKEFYDFLRCRLAVWDGRRADRHDVCVWELAQNAVSEYENRTTLYGGTP